jgi:hypothetical protein
LHVEVLEWNRSHVRAVQGVKRIEIRPQCAPESDAVHVAGKVEGRHRRMTEQYSRRTGRRKTGQAGLWEYTPQQ